MQMALAPRLFYLRSPAADERLGWAVALAVALHTALILGVTFVAPRVPPAAPGLEVTLTQYKEAAPARADFIAPTNQTGSGDAPRAREMTATKTSQFGADREQDIITGAPAAAPTAQVRPFEELAVRTDTDQPGALPVDDVAEQVVHGPRTSTAPLHLDAAREVATLQARLDDASQWQARGPRVRRITSVSAQSTAEAYYLSAWRRHVEMVGNVNYPGEARRLKLYGSLRLLVAINPDGSLKDIRVLESSGFQVLDEGAVNIVRLAAPYPPFSADMRKSIDVLEIIRTWQFKRVNAGDGFSTGF